MKRVKKFQRSFAGDPEIARIDQRFGEDWSGDASVFIELVRREEDPARETVVRLTRETPEALLQMVRSEELGFHAYVEFASNRENDH